MAKITTQMLPNKKNDRDVLQIVIQPEGETEKSLLGAAYMLELDSMNLEDDHSLAINFTRA